MAKWYVANNCGTDKLYYLSLTHDANKWGFPVYVTTKEKATIFRTKKEAKYYVESKSDIIIK